MYKNPIIIKNHEQDHFGDPFLFRYDGKYYLYPSTKGGDFGVNCYTSLDLINFTYYGKVLEDKVSECAYAPEVIYYEGYFYLITSPKGMGHYLYKATSPLGPFNRVSENIHNMIDGSFYINDENKLFLLRANHKGISLLNIDTDGKTNSRTDLNAPLSGWTEGPGLFFNGEYYFLTYTGNNVVSTGYRIAYSSSNYFNHDFLEGINNPLLISTDGKCKRYGHSSTVLGPDLDSYYVCYHELQIKNDIHLPRRFLIDRASFNGRMMVVNSSTFNNHEPLLPLINAYGISLDYFDELNQNLYFYKKQLNEFTFEVNFKNKDTKIYLSYLSEKTNTYFVFGENIMLVKKINGIAKTLFSKVNNFNFDNFHTVRIIKDKNRIELFIDNAFISLINVRIKGKLGLFIPNKKDVLFNGLSKFAFSSSSSSYPTCLPGFLLINKKMDYLTDEIDGINYQVLKENETINYSVIEEKSKYFISIFASIDKDVLLLINDKTIKLSKANDEFDFNYYNLGFFDLKRKDNISIKVLKGQISYKCLKVVKVESFSLFNNFKKVLDEDRYCLSKKMFLVNQIDFKIKIIKSKLYQKAGILFNASNFSSDNKETRFSLSSYFVGVENNLLVIDRFNYKDERIYDVPVEYKEKNNIKIEINITNIKVYLNDILKIDTNIPLLTGYGRYGYYISKDSEINISNLKVSGVKENE